jgi:hypothetical protein
MTLSYKTFSVKFEHTVGGSGTTRVNRAVVTVYGDSEFAIKREIERQYPEYGDVVILEVEER